jgi:predicted lactoylglutathione lyase
MIGYVTLGTNDIKRAGAFYDQLLGALGAKRRMDSERFVLWSAGRGTAGLALAAPYDKQPATVGNGVMVALTAENPEQVAAIHQKALELGGVDEGPVGARTATFYAGYFRDLDGNKLVVFCMTKA